ncbi:fused MFS/spermidine synthase, partial [Patescibacteria group bacterium]|nr:fused MFS/spermidine synthase [Patescibacteria group bacterium]MBU1673049.1 fused MFS/spermidine synthase [Patescibacteria group bacterium]
MDKKIKYFIYLFVFVCGVAVMFLEMAAARMMAPYFGSSIFVWGNIIGIVLIALSAGYYFGGRIADKYPQKKTLMFFVICAGIYTSFIPIVFKFINDSLNFTHYFGSDFLLLVILGSFLSSLLFFAVPIFILGFVSPYAIRLTASDVINAGKVAGSLYAFSTLGSIVGTFGAAFVIVPFWGSRETVYLASFLLLVISAIGLIKKPYLLILALLPVALYFLQAGAAIKDSEEIIYEDDSMYQYIQVKERDGIKVLSVNEGMGTQSIYDSENILTNKYYDYLSISPYISNKVVKNGLIIGLAGGTLSRQINHFFPGM